MHFDWSDLRSSPAQSLRSAPLRLDELSTPALLLDLDCMERNMQLMAKYFRGRRAKLRPHFKGHQVLALAAEQIKAGAIGITCARLEHAAILVERNFEGILLASELAGENAIRRLVDLCRRGSVFCVIDNAKIVADMARIAGELSFRVNIVVDVDVGLGRCGVAPGQPALALTRLAMQKKLRFCGLMGYSGTVGLPHGPEREQAVHSALRPLLQTRSLIERSGIPIEMVTCGSTSDYAIIAAAPGVTEIQAGSYLLMDTSYAPLAPEFQPALTVLTTVISVNAEKRVVVDAGRKVVSCEKGLPTVKACPGLRFVALHAEHGIIETVGRQRQVEVGSRIEVTVPYLDSTLQLHTFMCGVRAGSVTERLLIEH